MPVSANAKPQNAPASFIPWPYATAYTPLASRTGARFRTASAITIIAWLRLIWRAVAARGRRGNMETAARG